MMKRKSILLALIIFASTSVINTVSAIDTDQLSDSDISLVQNMLIKLKPYIDERKNEGDANMLTFKELYSRLDAHEQTFMDAIRNLKQKKKKNSEVAKADFVAIENQALQVTDPSNPNNRFTSIIERQYLPKNNQEADETMMTAMEKDLGKRLLIESGYRSPAYQLYLFVFYLSNHSYSIKETNRWVALPGTSEHGAPERQALDFITLEGISGEHNPEEFDQLPEFKWLAEHADQFGFVLSYPKNNNSNSGYEPWHWRYQPPQTQPVK
ncbi:MAG: D-alanyl-D-alanine carboxypeptidase family protein [Candidatus Omnitrophica bacterium]|nr:D-alanyl-D-alanine carboxypeptidase family protein [Candidatus Omnitrophota bacterium]